MCRLSLVLLITALSLGCSYSWSASIDQPAKPATIDDSWVTNPSSTKADIFYVVSIDGEKVPNAQSQTRKNGYSGGGTGFKVVGGNRSRSVDARPVVLELAGSIYLNAPVAYLFNAGKNFHIQGKLEFEPKPGRYYVVKGVLEEDLRAVWLEDIDGNIVSNRLVSRGKQDRAVPPEIEQVALVETAAPDTATLATSGTVTSEHEVGGGQAEADADSDLARFQRMSRIDVGDSMASVLARLGDPQSSEVKTSFGGLRKRETLHYGTLGSVVVTTDDEAIASVAKVTPEVLWMYKTYGMRFLEVLLQTPQTRSLSRDVARLASLKFFPPEELAYFASWFESNLSSEDAYVANAMAYVCYLLARSTTVDYGPLIARAAGEGKDKRLVRHATKALKTLEQSRSVPTRAS